MLSRCFSVAQLNYVIPMQVSVPFELYGVCPITCVNVSYMQIYYKKARNKNNNEKGLD